MAIDPPYRFDPFQNLVNVHWGGEGPEPFAQYFVYRRWVGWPYWRDFYPVSEDFYLSCVASGEAFSIEDKPGRWTTKWKLSDAVNQCLHLGYADSDIWMMHHWITDELSILEPVQPARNPTGYYDYYFIGIHTVDDMSTSDWTEALGDVNVPPFEPLPPE